MWIESPIQIILFVIIICYKSFAMHEAVHLSELDEETIGI